MFKPSHIQLHLRLDRLSPFYNQPKHNLFLIVEIDIKHYMDFVAQGVYNVSLQLRVDCQFIIC